MTFAPIADYGIPSYPGSLINRNQLDPQDFIDMVKMNIGYTYPGMTFVPEGAFDIENDGTRGPREGYGARDQYAGVRGNSGRSGGNRGGGMSNNPYNTNDPITTQNANARGPKLARFKSGDKITIEDEGRALYDYYEDKGGNTKGGFRKTLARLAGFGPEVAKSGKKVGGDNNRFYGKMDGQNLLKAIKEDLFYSGKGNQGGGGGGRPGGGKGPDQIVVPREIVDPGYIPGVIQKDQYGFTPIDYETGVAGAYGGNADYLASGRAFLDGRIGQGRFGETSQFMGPTPAVRNVPRGMTSFMDPLGPVEINPVENITYASTAGPQSTPGNYPVFGPGNTFTTRSAPVYRGYDEPTGAGLPFLQQFLGGF